MTAVRPSTGDRRGVASKLLRPPRQLGALACLDLPRSPRRSRRRTLTTPSSTTRTPPSPIAPIASSGWCGAPSLRTTITSSGADERERDLERHRNTAAWQTEHDDVVSPRSTLPPIDALDGTDRQRCASRLGQPTAGVSTIGEVHRHPLSSGAIVAPLRHRWRRLGALPARGRSDVGQPFSPMPGRARRPGRELHRYRGRAPRSASLRRRIRANRGPTGRPSSSASHRRGSDG